MIGYWYRLFLCHTTLRPLLAAEQELIAHGRTKMSDGDQAYLHKQKKNIL